MEEENSNKHEVVLSCNWVGVAERGLGSVDIRLSSALLLLENHTVPWVLRLEGKWTKGKELAACYSNDQFNFLSESDSESNTLREFSPLLSPKGFVFGP